MTAPQENIESTPAKKVVDNVAPAEVVLTDTSSEEKEISSEITKEQTIQLESSYKESNEEAKHSSNVLSTLLAILLIVFSFYLYPKIHLKITNYYKRNWYLPKDQLNLFIDHPIDDLTFKIPVYYSSEFNFPDFGDAVNIQLQGRLKEKDSIVINYEFDFQQGDYDKFMEGGYSNDTFDGQAMFLRLLLSTDNAIKVDGIYSYADLYFTLAAINTNDLPFFITQLLVDYCFNDELKFYEIDNFFKVKYPKRDRETLAHYNYDKFNKWNQNITLSFAMLGESKTWNVDDAFNNHLNEYLALLSGIYSFNYTEWKDILPEEHSIEVYSDDEHFPVELLDIPALPQLYDLTKDINDTSRFYLTYYPIDLAGENILGNKTLNNGTTNLISEGENTFHSISDWGIVYFAHGKADKHDQQEQSEDYGEPTEVSETSLKDCMWTFMEGILDYLEMPNSNMAPKMRVSMYKRMIIVHNLIRFSNLLFRIDCWLDDNDKLITNDLVNSVRFALQLRKQVLDLCLVSKVDDALNRSREMLELLGNQIDLLEIGNDAIANVDLDALDLEYNLLLS